MDKRSKFVIFVVLIVLGVFIFWELSKNQNSALQLNFFSEQSDIPPIYVAIAVYNSNGSIDYTKNISVFMSQRKDLVDFAEFLKTRGVKPDFLTDGNFLQAVMWYDRGSPYTAEKNIFKFFKEDLGIEIGFYSNESQYNYSDLAYILKLNGVEAQKTVCGFVIDENSEKLNYLQNDINSRMYQYSWRPNKLCAANLLNQKNYASGIWKPTNDKDFFNNNENSLPYFGSFSPDWNGLQELINLQQQGRLEKDKMYTHLILVNQVDLSDRKFFKIFKQNFENYSQLAQEKYIVWNNMSEIFKLWEKEFESHANIFQAEN